MRQAVIHRHEFDNLRFDVGIEDSTFYLRADSKEKREEWVVALEKTKVLLFLLLLLLCGMWNVNCEFVYRNSDMVRSHNGSPL